MKGLLTNNTTFQRAIKAICDGVFITNKSDPCCMITCVKSFGSSSNLITYDKLTNTFSPFSYVSSINLGLVISFSILTNGLIFLIDFHPTTKGMRFLDISVTALVQSTVGLIITLHLIRECRHDCLFYKIISQKPTKVVVVLVFTQRLKTLIFLQ